VTASLRVIKSHQLWSSDILGLRTMQSATKRFKFIVGLVKKIVLKVYDIAFLKRITFKFRLTECCV